jgi:putative oxidoreductase
MPEKYLASGGRVLLSLVFILSALGKLAGWESSQQYMASKGLPLVPVLLGLAIAVELAGGLSVLLGWHARWGALLLFLFLIPTTLIFHNFWSLAGMERQTEMTNFLKNLAIMGGLLLLAAQDRILRSAHYGVDVDADRAQAPLRRAG